MIAAFSSGISALAIAADGKTAVALDEGKLLVGASPDDAAKGASQTFAGKPAYVTALAYSPRGDLYVCIGSVTHIARRNGSVT